MSDNLGSIRNDSIWGPTGVPEPSKTSATNALQSVIAQTTPNLDAKEATSAASTVEEKSIDDVQKSKLTLKTIAKGIKNLISVLVKNLVSIVKLAKNLTPEEKEQINAAMAKGQTLAPIIGKAVGIVHSTIGNFIGGKAGATAVGVVLALVELIKIAKKNATQLDKIVQDTISAATKEAANATTNVEQKSIDDIQKSKLSLQSIWSGIKNHVSNLVKKIKSLIETAKSLTPEEKERITQAVTRGVGIATVVGGVVGSALPEVGSLLCGAIGVAVVGSATALIELNRIAEEHAEQMNAINDQAQQDAAQEAAQERGQAPDDLAPAPA
ncbi:MAG: hypothetical protein LBJ81_02075 [Puniceicoccales bacterium]|jgi:hypothetical protein|nr:hypothetical protein [Puniceicoccales bacterium]